jgi:hypothetical protein
MPGPADGRCDPDVLDRQLPYAPVDPLEGLAQDLGELARALGPGRTGRWRELERVGIP